ncbi:MAG TPA: EamA family transporter [Armatimonadota bacterium]|nr:EamA family transporter [Armatimonadota bacterium]
MGYFYAILALVAFAVLGISYKMSDVLRCDKSQANFFLFLFAEGFMLGWVLIGRPEPITWSSIGFGISLGLAIFLSIVLFRRAIALGRISISWTIINLALIAPVLASVTVWHETPSPRHCLGFALTLAAIVLLGIDMGRAGE